MKKQIALILAVTGLFIGGKIQAQNIYLSPDSLNLGTHLKGEEALGSLWIVNHSGADFNVQDVNIYGMDYSLPARADTSFLVKNEDSVEVKVRFVPRHNIEYNGELTVHIANKGAWKADIRATGQYPGTYYATTFNLSEEALKTALKTQLGQGYVSLGYNTARDWIYMSVDNEKTNGGGTSVNTLYTCYTGRKLENYVSRQDAQSNHNVNTEHTWPQSKFGSSEPMQSDMFHLFVVDAGVNSRRSNYPFAKVGSPSWTDNGAKYGSSQFEPRDAQKGVTARAMLYFVTRYQNYGNFLSESVTDENGLYVQQEVLMRRWAAAFPPTEKDSLRNEAIFKLQKNRNPFIDHPEFLERITWLSQNSVAPQHRTFETGLPMGQKLFFQGTAGDTFHYQLVVTNTGNTLLPVSVKMKDGSPATISSSLFNVEPGESKVVEIEITRNQKEDVIDSLLIESSSAPGLKKAYGIEAIFNTVGVKKVIDSGFNLYPNPTDGNFNIVLDEPVQANMEIRNAAGQLVYSAELNGQLSEISLPNPLPGLYFVRIIQGHRVTAQTLVVR